MEYLRNLLIVKFSNQPETLINSHTCSLEILKKQAECFHADELQVMFSVLSKAEMEMKRSSLSQMVFEMALLRLIETRPFKKIDELIEKINQAENDNIEPVQHLSEKTNSKESPPVSTTVNQNTQVSWDQIKQQITRTKPFFEHYLEKCQVSVFSDKEIKLVFSDNFTFDLVEAPENIQFLKETIKTVFGHDVDIKLTLDTLIQESPVQFAAEEKKKFVAPETGKQKSETEIIQDALDIFGGIVVK